VVPQKVNADAEAHPVLNYVGYEFCVALEAVGSSACIEIALVERWAFEYQCSVTLEIEKESLESTVSASRF
jgi:hypothetical protein